MQADEARDDEDDEDDVDVALVLAEDPARDIETAVAMDCDRIHFGFSTLVETKAMEVAQEAGLWVNTGTLSGPNQYGIARKIDVDGFSADSADTYTEAEPLD